MIVNTEDYKRLVDNFTAERRGYLQQLHMWLGAGSAGAVIAITTLAASLPNHAYAFQYLLPSYWCFLLGLVAAGTSIFALAMNASEKGQHFASAHNREDLTNAINHIPEVNASPPSLATRMNAERDSLIRKREIEHNKAEKAWAKQEVWHVIWVVSLAISCGGFVGGFGWPLIQTGLGHPIVPVETAAKSAGEAAAAPIQNSKKNDQN